MPTPTSCATWIVSIDLDSPERLSLEDQRKVDSAARSLIALCGERNLAATWTSTQPGASRIITEVLSEDPEHEIALHVGRSLLQTEPPQANSIREVSRELLRAKASGYAISTLAVSRAAAQEGWPALSKLGVTAIRSVPAQNAAAARSLQTVLKSLTGFKGSQPQPGLHRYGIREMPATMVLADARASFRRLRKSVDRAVESESTVHLLLDVPQMALARKSNRTIAEQILEYAAAMRRAGKLQIETVSTAVARQSPHRSLRPAQSILRRAA